MEASWSTSMATTTQRTTVEHPYLAAGILLMLVALVLMAFDLGVLARCGGGEGICFDVASHGTSDAALVAFIVLFFVGILLVMFTESGSTVTRTESAPRAPPQVTVVTPAAAPAPANITINTPAPAPVAPPAMVTVNTPR
jgi:hypothetical protein